MVDLAGQSGAELRRIDGLPAGFLDCPANKLDTLLDGPTLMRLRGRRRAPLFVSVLLHGNEVSGLIALQRLLRELERRGASLPRDLLIFIGNIEAASHGVRRLPGQPDYNRIWAGGEHVECRMAAELLQALAHEPLFAAMDVHNNTGRNPIYACVNRIEPRYIDLARRFSNTLVYFTEPHEVISIALSNLCPSVTLECGRPGEPEGIARVCRFLEECLWLKALGDGLPPDASVEVFHTVARITVSESQRIGFGRRTDRYELCLVEKLEALNFRPLPAGTLLGWRRARARGLIVTDEQGRDVSDRYIEYQGEHILIRSPCLLCMLTSDITVIRQDCLAYVMEPYPLPR